MDNRKQHKQLKLKEKKENSGKMITSSFFKTLKFDFHC